MKYICSLFLTFVFFTSCGQNKPDASKGKIKSETKSVITRDIIQDRKGNIWIASWEGVFRYDGKSFTNITSKVSSEHFFSVLEDRKGNLWFGSTGSGVYFYDGKSFRNFTAREGLAGNGVTCIYEDKIGNIWFGTNGGVSSYDGKSFRNYMMNRGVNSIIEDKTGKFWIATADNTFVYNGKTFTTFTNNGKSFRNVRSIIEDKKGNVWLCGYDGLWRYNGGTFTNFTGNFVGYVYEDKQGNIWTSSEPAKGPGLALSRYDENFLSGSVSAKGQWVLSRYDEKSLSDKEPTVTEIATKPMIFGILEDDKGSIWFGAADGVYRYDGNTITSFNGKEAEK